MKIAVMLAGLVVVAVAASIVAGKLFGKKEPPSLTERLKAMKNITDATAENEGGGFIIVGFQQKPKGK